MIIDNGDGTFTDSETGMYVNPETGQSYTLNMPMTTTMFDGDNIDAGEGGGGWNPATSSTALPGGETFRDASGNILNKLGQVIVPAAASLATPWWNNLQSGGLLNAATGMLTSAGNAINNVQNPNLVNLIPTLQLQVQQGLMTPAQATAALQTLSNMQDVSSDQYSLDVQKQALDRLSEISTQGLTAADQAAISAAINQANNAQAQQRLSQIQQLQMQGTGGSGAELAARLIGSQMGANTGAQIGAQVAGQQQQRALQALQSSLTGGAAFNTEQFRQAAERAKAQDIINQFNTNAMNQVAQQNAARTQEANLANFNTANTIAGKNVETMNRQAMLPMETAQKQFSNALETGKARTASQLGGGKALGEMATGQIQRSGKFGESVGANRTAAGTAAGGVAGQQNDPNIFQQVGQAANAVNAGIDLWNTVSDWLSDERLKTDKQELSDDDVDDMMGKLTGYKYRYKGSKTNPDQVGVMAQDMPKDSVVDTPAGKMVQGPQVLGQALAILANQHERIKRLEGNK